MNFLKKLFGKKLSKHSIEENSESYEANENLDNCFSNQVDRNLKGKEYEQTGEVELAIKEYEENVKEVFEGSHPYNRLAIIYRKKKDYDNEIRILNIAIEIYTELSTDSPRQDVDPKLVKFIKRLEKAKELQKSVG